MENKMKILNVLNFGRTTNIFLISPLMLLPTLYVMYQLFNPDTQRKPWEDFSLISVIGQMFICGIFLSIYLVICFKIISVAKAMIKRTLIRIKPKLANTLTKTQDGKI